MNSGIYETHHSENTPGIRLERLSRRFGATAAVDDVSLAIQAGEFLVLLGPSGCGKTTLLRMVAGLVDPSGGSVILDGRDVTRVPARERDLAMVFQSYALYPHLSVARNVGFSLRMRGACRPDVDRRVAEVARLLDLDHLLTRKPGELSGGQRQRVALGRAIVREPRAFLMDEPLSNLDAKLRTQTRAELVALHRRLATTFVYVTHDQVEAMTMATRIVVMNRGRVEQVGTPIEVYDQPASSFVAGFLGAPPMNLIDAEAAGDASGLRVRAVGVDAVLEPAGEAGRAVVLGVRPEHLRLRASGDGPRLDGIVELVETLGSEQVAYCAVGAARVALRGPRPLGLSAGDVVVLTADVEHFHLFDRHSGRRPVRRDAAPRSADPEPRKQETPTC